MEQQDTKLVAFRLIMIRVMDTLKHVIVTQYATNMETVVRMSLISVVLHRLVRVLPPDALLVA